MPAKQFLKGYKKYIFISITTVLLMLKGFNIISTDDLVKIFNLVMSFL